MAKAKTKRSKKSVRKSSKKTGSSVRTNLPAVQTYSFSDVQQFFNGHGIRKQTELVNGKGKTVVTTFPDGKVVQKLITK